jgi:hypothetical protein
MKPYNLSHVHKQVFTDDENVLMYNDEAMALDPDTSTHFRWLVRPLKSGPIASFKKIRFPGGPNIFCVLLLTAPPVDRGGVVFVVDQTLFTVFGRS